MMPIRNISRVPHFYGSPATTCGFQFLCRIKENGNLLYLHGVLLKNIKYLLRLKAYRP